MGEGGHDVRSMFDALSGGSASITVASLAIVLHEVMPGADGEQVHLVACGLLEQMHPDADPDGSLSLHDVSDSCALLQS